MIFKEKNIIRWLGLALAVLLAGCATRPAPEMPPPSSSRNTSRSTAAGSPSGDGDAAETEPQAEPVEACLMAAGDNLIHDVIYQQAAKRSADEGDPLGYDFLPAYEEVASILSQADVAFINQETVLASEVSEPSSYPLFNSPTQVGDTILELGFNLISHANNHVFDKGEKGIFATLDYWDTKEDENIAVAGVYRTEEDRDEIRTLKKNGITFSLVAFTEHTNGLKLREDSPAQVIYTSETDLIKAQIQAARKVSDVVVVSVHWGVENSSVVTDAQKNLAQQMADWGADIILGTHPHVLQPIEPLTCADGRSAFVIYSLGNFISAQDQGANLISGILRFDIAKYPDTGEIRIKSPKLIPIVTHFETAYCKNLKLYPVEEYTHELAASHGVLRKTPSFSMQYIADFLEDVIGETYLEKPLSVYAGPPIETEPEEEAA